MCLVISDVDAGDYVDCKVDDVLPVVLSCLIRLPYAAGTVDYQRYVYETTYNMNCSTSCIGTLSH